jgi:hypothetical protein
MKRFVLLITLIMIGLYLNAQEFGCSNMSANWKSEKEAIRRIENTIFNSSESIVPDENSWMTSAHFYTCDNEFGYLIVKSEKKTFVHQDVPIVKWNALKGARAIGGFYNFYIKDLYKLEKTGAKSPIL